MSKPKVAVWKFASCDGCQLSLLDCEEELLAVAENIEIAYFLEATRATQDGPYDVSIVEGSITTDEDIERIKDIRKQSSKVVAIGACAVSGGIQALKNFSRVDDFINAVYAHPEYINTLSTSTPMSDHVKVDFELQGCPINKMQLVEVIKAYLHDREPRFPRHSVCIECKRRGTVCVMVSKGLACLGPVTQAGCGAICPSYHRGCFGCYGPMENPNPAPLDVQFAEMGLSERDRERLFSTYYVNSPAFREHLGLDTEEV